MRALDPEVFDAVWAEVEPLLPAPVDDHPLGCHRLRVPDRICLFAMLVRLVTGCSWVDAERLTGGVVSDTTLRARRDEWIETEVFDQLVETMLAVYDAKVGLEPAEALVDGSIHKAPCGGEGTGKSPVDRGRLGWKWSIATDVNGIPMGWVVAPANTNDSVLLPAPLEAVDDQASSRRSRRCTWTGDMTTASCADRSPRWASPTSLSRRSDHHTERDPGRPSRVPLGRRWPVERTNSWLTNYGQLRRNTDRKAVHRSAQLAFVIAILLTAKLLDGGHLTRS